MSTEWHYGYPAGEIARAMVGVLRSSAERLERLGGETEEFRDRATWLRHTAREVERCLCAVPDDAYDTVVEAAVGLETLTRLFGAHSLRAANLLTDVAHRDADWILSAPALAERRKGQEAGAAAARQSEGAPPRPKARWLQPRPRAYQMVCGSGMSLGAEIGWLEDDDGVWVARCLVTDEDRTFTELHRAAAWLASALGAQGFEVEAELPPAAGEVGDA